MELKSALEQLGLLQKKLYAYQTASSSLYLDSVTVAPKDTSEGRGVALGILAGESQKLMKVSICFNDITVKLQILQDRWKLMLDNLDTEKGKLETEDILDDSY